MAKLEKDVQEISVTPERRMLSKIAGKQPQIEGISVFQRVEERPPWEDCIFYLWWGRSIYDMQDAMETWQPSAPIPGAVAFYLGEDRRVLHVGRVAEDGDIISKWGW